MSLLDGDDDDGISRRTLLGGAAAAFVVGLLSAEEREEAVLAGGGAVKTTTDALDMQVIIDATIDDAAAQIDTYPALLVGRDTGNLAIEEAS